jgi:hypothetical protein
MKNGSKPRLDANHSFATCLNHDHRERENIGFFAVRSLLVQDLWRSPPPHMTLFARGASDRIQVLSDPGKPKIGDSRVVGGI